MHLPCTVPKEILGEISPGWNLIFWDSAGRFIPPGKVGKRQSLAMWSCRQSELHLAELKGPKAGGDTLLERGVLSRLKVLSDCKWSAAEGKHQSFLLHHWPRLQLVLGYFLSQIAYPRKGAALLSHSETRARNSLNRQRSYAPWIHCYQQKLAAFHLDCVLLELARQNCLWLKEIWT